MQLRDDGTARVACGTQDIGTGTYTILAQLASQKTGVPLDKVEVALGDTSLPEGPISGGSMATGSVVPAVFAAADSAIASLLTIATTTPGSPFEKRKPDELAFEDGRVFVKADGPAGGVPFADLLRRANLRLVTGSGKSEATFGNPKPKFSTHSFGCHFVEVTWQPEIARLRVSRVVTVIDAGRILNPLAGRNQIEGAVVMGIGMALLEHTTYDPQNGAPINSNLADYIVAVNADVAADRSALPRLPRQGDQRAGRARHRRDRPGRLRRRHHGGGAPRDGRSRAGTAGEDREPVGLDVALVRSKIVHAAKGSGPQP